MYLITFKIKYTNYSMYFYLFFEKNYSIYLKNHFLLINMIGENIALCSYPKPGEKSKSRGLF